MIKKEFVYDEVTYSKKIEHQIRKFIINTKKYRPKLAIYPYGKVGQLTKSILNDVYSIMEDYIFDGELYKYNDNIFNLVDFKKEELEDVVVIITSDNIDCYNEIREIASSKFKEENIYDVFGKVCVDNDVRVETLRQNAKRINEVGIPGSVAELGVYKGKFSKEINKYFKNRALYMFDTFEGFLNEQLMANTDERFMSQLEAIANGDYCAIKSVESILEDFVCPEKCIIKKGFFPDTAEGIEDTFCFVSLDVDIYQSTKDGLEYFWPIMEKGGIIMVHDYNNQDTPGVKTAVDEFVKKYDIPIIMISDWAGSAILYKIM